MSDVWILKKKNHASHYSRGADRNSVPPKVLPEIGYCIQIKVGKTNLNDQRTNAHNSRLHNMIHIILNDQICVYVEKMMLRKLNTSNSKIYVFYTQGIYTFRRLHCSRNALQFEGRQPQGVRQGTQHHRL